ncbi:MAG TPA: hypothetical protein VME42_15155 [Steroidobacteraceae bacterium]|nr:hypothetical protein [Steroidobacteraceae bacterium]
MSARETALRAGSVLGALFAYGCFGGFLLLIGLQLYRWFENGEWTHIGVNDGMRATLAHLAGADGLTGWRAALAHWIDAPVKWLGLHKVLDVLPASMALFAISVVGNSIFIYTTDRLREEREGVAAPAAEAAVRAE